ncbi:metallophosphatase family protein [bacterium]|nr:metallophosphatase family protein [bacterium]
MKVGVISDTHGFIDPKVFTVFDGVELILHAGDIGSEDIITSLETIAPVKAIHGNIDTFPLSTRYPEVLAIEMEGVAICIIHQFIDIRNSKIRDEMAKTSKAQPDILIFGHSHQAKLEYSGEMLLFNPGSAGRRRFSLRPAVGLLTLSEESFTPRIVYLDED